MWVITRLYAAARIRGLKTRQNVGNNKALPCRLLRMLKMRTSIWRKSLGNDKALKSRAKLTRSLPRHGKDGCVIFSKAIKPL
jgi:hypothetical protein